ncbi:MAG: hypothetical protein IKA36_00825 [Clostridia bacterium]|nr:hypothetical protein [Clostridia bacterium]
MEQTNHQLTGNPIADAIMIGDVMHKDKFQQSSAISEGEVVIDGEAVIVEEGEQIPDGMEEFVAMDENPAYIDVGYIPPVLPETIEESNALDVIISIGHYKDILGDFQRILNPESFKNLYDDTWLKNSLLALANVYRNQEVATFIDTFIRTKMHEMYTYYIQYKNENIIVNLGKEAYKDHQDEYEKVIGMMETDKKHCYAKYSEVWYGIDSLVLSRGLNVDEVFKGSDSEVYEECEDPYVLFGSLVNHVETIIDQIYKKQFVHKEIDYTAPGTDPVIDENHEEMSEENGESEVAETGSNI